VSLVVEGKKSRGRLSQAAAEMLWRVWFGFFGGGGLLGAPGPP